MNVSRPVGNVASFIREAEEVPKSLKYKSEKSTKHRIYFPFIKEVKNVDGVDIEENGLKAITVDIHDVTDVEGNYKGTYCTRGHVHENGGTGCVYCDAVQKSWRIFEYQMQREKETCKITNPTELANHLENKRREFLRGLKVTRPSKRLYILIAQYVLDSKGKPVINSDTKLPEFELKVMRTSYNRLVALEGYATDADYASLGGTEFTFAYDDKEDRYRQSRDTVIPETKRFIDMYPGLKEAIDKEVATFDFEKISSFFYELREVADGDKQNVVDGLFAAWDTYCLELKTNPNAEYLEDKVGSYVALETERESSSGGVPANADDLFADVTL